jgi:hypothetical protein
LESGIYDQLDETQFYFSRQDLADFSELILWSSVQKGKHNELQVHHGNTKLKGQVSETLMVWLIRNLHHFRTKHPVHLRIIGSLFIGMIQDLTLRDELFDMTLGKEPFLPLDDGWISEAALLEGVKLASFYNEPRLVLSFLPYLNSGAFNDCLSVLFISAAQYQSSSLLNAVAELSYSRKVDASIYGQALGLGLLKSTHQSGTETFLGLLENPRFDQIPAAYLFETVKSLTESHHILELRAFLFKLHVLSRLGGVLQEFKKRQDVQNLSYLLIHQLLPENLDDESLQAFSDNRESLQQALRFAETHDDMELFGYLSKLETRIKSRNGRKEQWILGAFLPDFLHLNGGLLISDNQLEHSL